MSQCPATRPERGVTARHDFHRRTRVVGDNVDDGGVSYKKSGNRWPHGEAAWYPADIP